MEKGQRNSALLLMLVVASTLSVVLSQNTVDTVVAENSPYGNSDDVHPIDDRHYQNPASWDARAEADRHPDSHFKDQKADHHFVHGEHMPPTGTDAPIPEDHAAAWHRQQTKQSRTQLKDTLKTEGKLPDEHMPPPVTKAAVKKLVAKRKVELEKKEEEHIAHLKEAAKSQAEKQVEKEKVDKHIENVKEAAKDKVKKEEKEEKIDKHIENLKDAAKDKVKKEEKEEKIDKHIENLKDAAKDKVKKEEKEEKIKATNKKEEKKEVKKKENPKKAAKDEVKKQKKDKKINAKNQKILAILQATKEGKAAN